MASYHLSAQVISRGSGHSAVHAAAYRGRDNLFDERTGLKHDYSKKSGELLFEGIYAPKDAPDWARDRQQLWNHVEAFEKRRDAQLAREFNMALPCELTLEQNRYALQDWVRDNFTRKGQIADVVIHAPSELGDERNMHAHVMVVMRKLDGTEFAAKKERAASIGERKAELESLRESWASIGNRHLVRHGFKPSLDHRTLDAQGIEREPTVHMGKSAAAIERTGRPSELGDVNRQIIAENERKVIDLAAERAMRQARDATKGQVDDIRPLDQQQKPLTLAERFGTLPMQTEKSRARDDNRSLAERFGTLPTQQDDAPKTAPEALQGQYAAAAPSGRGQPATRATEPQREAQEGFSRASTDDGEDAVKRRKKNAWAQQHDETEQGIEKRQRDSDRGYERD
jgi:hypothetical protein